MVSNLTTESVSMDTSSVHDSGEGSTPRGVNCHTLRQELVAF